MENKMGYHLREIKKGTIGEASKIEEEFFEFKDAIEQDNKVMALVELCDLIGAIELYTVKNFNISLNDLIIMKKATESAFMDGNR
jgi:hypothetical protein